MFEKLSEVINKINLGLMDVKPSTLKNIILQESSLYNTNKQFFEMFKDSVIQVNNIKYSVVGFKIKDYHAFYDVPIKLTDEIFNSFFVSFFSVNDNIERIHSLFVNSLLFTIYDPSEPFSVLSGYTKLRNIEGYIIQNISKITLFGFGGKIFPESLNDKNFYKTMSYIFKRNNFVLDFISFDVLKGIYSKDHTKMLPSEVYKEFNTLVNLSIKNCEDFLSILKHEHINEIARDIVKRDIHWENLKFSKIFTKKNIEIIAQNTLDLLVRDITNYIDISKGLKHAR